MELTQAQTRERKRQRRTFKERTTLGRMQDRITELELRIEELEQHSPMVTEEELNLWKTELQEINGIGPETANDIASIFPSKELLIIGFHENKVNFRNDINTLLREKFYHG